LLKKDPPIVDSKGKKCGEFSVDYGKVIGNYLVGGRTCHIVDARIDRSLTIGITRDTLGVCKSGKKKIRIHGESPIEVYLAANKIYYVEEGDRIPGLYAVLGMNTVDKSTEIKMCRHEAGHQRDNARLVSGRTSYIRIDEIGCDCESKALNSLIKAGKNMKDYYLNLIEEEAKTYHNNYGDDRAPADVECPN